MMETIRDDGLKIVRQSYTDFVDGRSVVVHNVPYLYDEISGRFLLSPDVAEELYDLIHNPALRKTISSTDVYAWSDTEIPVPQLAIRFAGKGMEYGETPITLFANTIDRVKRGASGLVDSLRKMEGVRRPQNLFTSEPRVAYIGSGSLVVALEAPQEGLFPEETEQRFVQSAVELLVDAALWITDDDENAEPPGSLSDTAVRATTLRHLEKILPNKGEKNREVEFSGREVTKKIGRPVRLFSETRTRTQKLYLDALAEVDSGESIRLDGLLKAVDIGGRAKLIDIEDWEKKSIDLRFDKDEHELVNDMKLALGAKVTVSGILHRRADGQLKHLDAKFVVNE